MEKKKKFIVNCVLGKKCEDAPGWIYCLDEKDRRSLIVFIYNFFRTKFEDNTSQAIKDTKRYISDEYYLQEDPHHLYLFWRDLYYWKLH